MLESSSSFTEKTPVKGAMRPQDPSNPREPTYKYRVLSEVDRLRILRSLYKKEAQKTYEEIYEKLQLERRESHQKVGKTEILLQYNRSILQQIDQQRQAVANTLDETVNTARIFVMQKNQARKNLEELRMTESYAKTLLSELTMTN